MLQKVIGIMVAFAGLTLVAAGRVPNVIVIMVDDMGYGGLSCYDNTYYKTPEIDRMAAEGIKLMDFHSNGAVCSPTRAALLTGRYQQRTGCDGVVNADPEHPMHQRGLKQEEWTFAEAMKEAGYATAVFGKWHLGYKPEFHPMTNGFDEFAGFISGNIDAQSHYDRMSTFDWWQGRELKDEPGHHSDLITEHALDFIERHKEKPFFLYLPHGTPHSPFQARGSKVGRGPDKGKVPEWAPKETYSNTPGAEDWLIRHFMLPVDEGVGRIREKIEELGLAKDTIVWFCSDNGGVKGNYSQTKRLKAGKGSAFEGGHRVPCIVWAPGRIASGKISGELILGFDIMPTSMALAGIQPPTGHKLDGVDVGTSLFRDEALPERIRFWGMGPGKGAVRDGNWKLVLEKKEFVGLYNLAEDLGEKKNLAQQHPERVKGMKARWEEWYAETMASSPYAE
jgi:arylsulfatase A-like enzyme